MTRGKYNAENLNKNAKNPIFIADARSADCGACDHRQSQTVKAENIAVISQKKKNMDSLFSVPYLSLF